MTYPAKGDLKPAGGSRFNTNKIANLLSKFHPKGPAPLRTRRDSSLG